MPSSVSKFSYSCRASGGRRGQLLSLRQRMIMCTTAAKSFQMKLTFVRALLEIETVDEWQRFRSSSWPASSSIELPFDQRRNFSNNLPWPDQRMFLPSRRRFFNDNCLLVAGASSDQNKQVWKRPAWPVLRLGPPTVATWFRQFASWRGRSFQTGDGRLFKETQRGHGQRLSSSAL